MNAGMTTFSQLVAGDCRAKPMAVTFDDGYVSVYENAMPILKELGLPGTIFMPTALIGNEPIAAWPGLEARYERRSDPAPRALKRYSWLRIGLYAGDDMLRFSLKVSPTLPWLRSTGHVVALERFRHPNRPAN